MRCDYETCGDINHGKRKEDQKIQGQEEEKGVTSMSTECEICGEKVAKIYECEVCGVIFCNNCGSSSDKICIGCSEWKTEEN